MTAPESELDRLLMEAHRALDFAFKSGRDVEALADGHDSIDALQWQTKRLSKEIELAQETMERFGLREHKFTVAGAIEALGKRATEAERRLAKAHAEGCCCHPTYTPHDDGVGTTIGQRVDPQCVEFRALPGEEKP